MYAFLLSAGSQCYCRDVNMYKTLHRHEHMLAK